MNDYLILLIYFISAYVLSFIVYYIYLKKSKKKDELLEIEYLIKKFNLPKNKESKNRIKSIMSLVNPLIIALTFIVVISIDSFILGVLIGFVIMVVLIYSIYEIIGRILKKEKSKNV